MERLHYQRLIPTVTGSCLTLLFFSFYSLSCSPRSTVDLSGTWEAEVRVDTTNRDIYIVELKGTDESGLLTMIHNGRRQSPLPLIELHQESSRLSWKVKEVRMEFHGRIESGGGRINGTLHFGQTASLDITFSRVSDSIASQPFVPDTFLIPDPARIGTFEIRTLTVEDAEPLFEDLEASRTHLRTVPSGEWELAGRSPMDTVEAIRRYEKESKRKTAFTYGIFSMENGLILGEVHIRPDRFGSADAQVFFWLRQSAYEEGLEPAVEEEIRHWLKESWPFATVTFPGRTP